jgi:Uma2 family endonuclease
MATGTTLVSAAEFAELSVELDGLCELVRGEVREMTRPGARHCSVCAAIAYRLMLWTEATKAGVVLTNDVGIWIEREEDTVRGPDAVYIRRDALPNGELPAGWIEFPPDLCVEVLSPSDRWPEVLEKVAEYLEFGVPEVWVADPQHKRLHVYRGDDSPRILEDAAILETPGLPGFQSAVGDFFVGC